jgi:hypothetical protein
MRILITTLLMSLLLSGCGFGSSSKAVATSTPGSTSAPNATAIPSVAPTLISPRSATPHTSVATAQTSSSSTTSDPVKRAEDAIRFKGYKAVSGSIAKTPDGYGKTLYALLGICEGSADGHCQKVFFFLNDQYLETDTKSPSNEIKSEMAAGTGNIDVTYANYKNNDPLCCPSGQPVTILYHWNGTRLIPSGRPPGH